MKKSSIIQSYIKLKKWSKTCYTGRLKTAELTLSLSFTEVEFCKNLLFMIGLTQFMDHIFVFRKKILYPNIMTNNLSYSAL